MNKSKRFLAVIGFVLMLAMLVGSRSVLALNLYSVNANTTDGNSVYSEIKEYTSEDFGEVIGYFNEKSNSFNSCKSDNGIKPNSKLYKQVVKKTYVLKEENRIERQLTNYDKPLIEEFKKLKMNGINNNSVYLQSQAPKIKQIYELTLIISIYEKQDSSKVGYYVIGEARWGKGPSVLVPNMQEVNDGEDCMFFSWGGGYDYSVRKIDRVYTSKDDSSSSMINIGSCRNVYGLANAKATIDLYKPKFTSGTTKLYLNYVHTYKNIDYSFTIGSSPSVTVSPSVNHWADFVEVTIKK